jgi:hypothetical protein
MTDTERAVRYALATTEVVGPTCTWVFQEGVAEGHPCRMHADYEHQGKPRCFRHLPLNAPDWHAEQRHTHDMVTM